jgi:predicted  nucleic acid-binding Zn-ribbon protein
MPTLEESRDAYLRAYGELNLDSSSRGAASVSQEPGGVADEFARLSERHLNDLALFSQEKSLLEHDRLVLEKEKSALEREKYVLEQHKLNLERGIRDLTDQSERLVDQVRDMVAQLVEKDYRIISGESRISQWKEIWRARMPGAGSLKPRSAQCGSA